MDKRPKPYSTDAENPEWTAKEMQAAVPFTALPAALQAKLRLDADVLAALRDSGDGWQTRINDMLRASLQLAGRLG